MQFFKLLRLQSKSLICREKKSVSENKLKSFDYGFKVFSPVNVKANFNFAVYQSKTFGIILVSTFDVLSLMLVKKQWSWLMLIVCSTLFNWRLLKNWVKHFVTTSFPCQALTILQSSNKKNWFVLETRKPWMFFVFLCSFLYRAWHLNNVRAPLVAISLCWSERPVTSVVKSVVDLSFFIINVMLQMKSSKISRIIITQSPVCFCF